MYVCTLRATILIMPCQLDLTVQGSHLTDSFGWDATATDDGQPEQFAQGLCDDLGLSPACATPVAVAIREQLLAHRQVCGMARSMTCSMCASFPISLFQSSRHAFCSYESQVARHIQAVATDSASPLPRLSSITQPLPGPSVVKFAPLASSSA